MRRTLAILATGGIICAIATPASADPFLSVTANHLGGGVMQYTLNANNDLGGGMSVVITAAGNIVQLLSTFQVPETAFPDGGSDSKSQADAADNFGATFGLPNETYNAFNGDGGLDDDPPNLGPSRRLLCGGIGSERFGAPFLLYAA